MTFTQKRINELVSRVKIIEDLLRHMKRKYAGQSDFEADLVFQSLCKMRIEWLIDLDQLTPGTYPIQGADIFK